jgi:hypothetical protein
MVDGLEIQLEVRDLIFGSTLEKIENFRKCVNQTVFIKEMFFILIFEGIGDIMP